jgi:chitodextrinase
MACGIGGAESKANLGSRATNTSGDTTPPTSPAGLSATTDGPFGSTLSWAASTDSVGVIGYKVERCQGAACGAFAEVATAAGASFTDTGLTAATPYSYRVRATDAAANLSAYSNMAGVTTSAAPPPPLANLPAWMNGLAIGQWFAIPNTSLSTVAPSPTPAGNSGPLSKVEAWTSMVVDTRTSKVYSVAGGGHQDYSGNEVDALDLEAAQPAWSELLAPTPNNQLTNCLPFYLDGRPAARHSYYGLTFSERTDRFMLFGGANWCDGGGFFTLIASYNITANTYSPALTHPNLLPVFAGEPAYTLDPATGDVYAAIFGNYGRWNSLANTFTKLTPSGSGPDGNNAMSAMDTARGRILILGGDGPGHHVYTLSNNSYAPIAPTGAVAANVSGVVQGAMVYVPAIDRYLIRLAGAGGTVYQVHPTTFDVSVFATTNGGAIPSTPNGPYNKFLYVPRLGGAVYVPSYLGNAWFLRTN